MCINTTPKKSCPFGRRMHNYERVTDLSNLKMKHSLERRRSQQPLRCQRPPMLLFGKTRDPSHKHISEAITTIQESFHPQHHGGYPPFQLEELNYWKVWWYQWPGWTPWRLHLSSQPIHYWWCCFVSSVPHILEGFGLSLVQSIAPNTVDSFDTLVSWFGMEFAINWPHHLTSLALVNIRQKKKESLWTLMLCFGKITLDIWNLDSIVAMHDLITTLRSEPFVKNLCKKLVSNMDELRWRAAKYVTS